MRAILLILALFYLSESVPSPADANNDASDNVSDNISAGDNVSDNARVGDNVSDNVSAGDKSGTGGENPRTKKDFSSFLRDLLGSLYPRVQEAIKHILQVQGSQENIAKNADPGSTGPTVCRSSDCVELSAFLKSNMNSSADPCEDFWEYSCGSWRGRFIPNNKLAWGPVNVMNDHISDMQKGWLEAPDGARGRGALTGLARSTRSWYKTCMNESAMEENVVELKAFIERLGGWAAAGTLSPNWTVTSGIEYLQEKNVLMPFYESKIVKDDKNISRNLIKLYQPSVMFEKTPYYYKSPPSATHKHIIDSYLTTITKFGKLLGLSASAASRFAATVYAFEKKMAAILVPYDSELLLEAQNTYNIIKMGNLSSVCPFLDLQRIFRGLSEDYFSNDDQDLLVFNTEFFGRLSRLLGSSSVGELNNYIVWTVASSAERFLPKRFRDGLNDFRLVRYGHKEKHMRWLQCAKSAPFPFVIGAHFVDKFFSEESRESAQSLIDDVRVAFAAGINASDWLDEETKEKAMEKMALMVTRIGYPDFITDEEKLVEFYSNYSFNYKSNLLRQRLDYLAHAKEKVVETLWLTNNRSEWFTNPMLVNAFYHRIDNSITFPAGILQPPLFKKDYPDFHNFGSMGYIMGHEMVHAFDHNGAKYDSEGNLREWMSKMSKQKYEANNRCISNFYSSLKIGGRKINGNITLGENIADIAGLKYAFNAYEAKAARKHPDGEATLPGLDVSPQKTFFLSFAAFHCKKWRPSLLDTLLSRSHAPSKTRVNGAVSQSQDFARIFNCPLGSKMNPINKCNVF